MSKMLQNPCYCCWKGNNVSEAMQDRDFVTTDR